MIVCYLNLPPRPCSLDHFHFAVSIILISIISIKWSHCKAICRAWLCQIQLQFNWVPNFPNSKISESSRSRSSYLELEILCLFGSEGCTTCESYTKATTKGNSKLVIKRLCTQGGVHHCQCVAFIIDNDEPICTIFWWLISWNYDIVWH
jgi:hypothetical protein